MTKFSVNKILSVLLDLIALIDMFLFYVRVTNGKLEFSVTFPGLTVQHSADNGTSWIDVDHNTEVAWGNWQVLQLRTRSSLSVLSI